MIDKIIFYIIFGSLALITIISAIPFFVMGIAIIAALFGCDLCGCCEVCK